MKIIAKIFLFIVVATFVAIAIDELLPASENSSSGFVNPFEKPGDVTPVVEDVTDYPAMEDLAAIRDFVIDQREEGNPEFSFIYSGDEELKPLMIAEIYGACYISWKKEGNIYHVTMSEYPGDRIVDAYFSGDDSGLSRDEQRVLEKTVEMVEEAKEQTNSDWELEKALYDRICQEVEYHTGDILYSDSEERPRFVSVIGAFLDGKANCQGYTDAFYTLARIAGFEVGRLGVETSTLGHMVNTICLNEKWYVVDVTFGDSEEGPVNYRLLNAGMDMIGEFWWNEELEPYPIADQTDEELFYYYIHDLVYDDIYDMAEDIADRWDRTGDKEILVMLRNESDVTKLSDILYDSLDKLEMSFSYHLFYSTNETDSFYAVVFS